MYQDLDESTVQSLSDLQQLADNPAALQKHVGSSGTAVNFDKVQQTFVTANNGLITLSWSCKSVQINMLLFFCKYYFVFGGIRRSGLCQKFLHHCMPRAYFHFFKLSYSDILYDVLLCLITISGAALPKNLNKRVFILTNQSDPTHGDAALQRAAKTRAGGCQCMCSCIRF